MSGWRYPPAWPNDGQRVELYLVTGDSFFGEWIISAKDGHGFAHVDLGFTVDKIDIMAWRPPQVPPLQANAQLALALDTPSPLS